jgi:ERCC4-type nuclease
MLAVRVKGVPNLLFSGVMPVRVLIDNRETELWTLLEGWATLQDAEGWYVERAQLELGDIQFESVPDISGAVHQPLVILERKSAEDLGASQKDGRYREQRARLLAARGAGTAIGYILEIPPWSPTLTRSWCRSAFTEVHAQQAIVRLQLRYGIPIFQAADTKGTVQWIRRIAGALVKDPAVFKEGIAADKTAAAAAYTEAIHVKKAANNSPERIFHSILLSIPGVGKTAVEALASATQSSFAALYTKTEEELAATPMGKRKLGKAVAHTIYAALH